MHPGIRIKAAANQKAGLAFRLKAVQLLSLSEPAAARIIFKLEQDPLFIKLSPFIHREPSRRSRFYLPLEDGSQAGQLSPGIAWSAYSREIALIKKIGQARFEKYFLYEDIAFTAEEVAHLAGLSLGEVKRVKGFVFAVSMQEHGVWNISNNISQVRHYSCIARIEPGNGKPVLSWLLPHLARGRYVVDFRSLNRLRKTALTGKESGRLTELLGTIAFLNARQSIIKRLAELVVSTQRKFFAAGDKFSLIPLTASDAAKKLKVYPSTVSRAFAGRSLLTPQGAELPLEFFLPNQRAIAVNAIAKLLAVRPEITDKVLAEELLKKYHITLSRRAVNECRRIASRQSGPWKTGKVTV